MDDIRIFFAPGRVNLIGEHTDYNDGFVLPFSLEYGTWLLARPSEEPQLKLRSMNFPMNAQVCLKKDVTPMGDSWVNYPLGVVKEFQKLGFRLGGLELLFAGNIPNEAGLSSSASVEMVMALALNEIFNCKISRVDLVKMGQRAENEFVGMNCGIMDQFAVTMGKANHAVFLNCGTLDYEVIPFHLNDYVILICNTNKKRGLAGSKYNERRRECEKAVELLNQKKKINSLSDLNLEEFTRFSHVINDPTIVRRARHVVSENDRVLRARQCLQNSELESLGKLMKESHASLRDDYEVSCRELDIMVSLADEFPEVLGSRMTGAGFGGCSISLLPGSVVEKFVMKVGAEYAAQTGMEADFYVARPGNGACEI